MKENKTAFVIGATGFLGQFLVISLLKTGWKVICLARGNSDFTPEERVSRSLSVVDRDIYIKYRGNVIVVEGNFIEKIPHIDENICAVFHAGGATSFSEKDRESTMSVNILGTRNILDFTRKIGVSELHYVSTAYVNDPGIKIAMENVQSCDRTYPNPYAESKCIAEREVLAWKDANSNCKAFIYRPSIIVGDSKTGLTTNFFGYYRFMRTFYVIGNAVARKNGRNGVPINIPVKVPGSIIANINIVTVDYVVDMMLRLQKSGKEGIFHLTNSNAPNYEELLQQSLRPLGIYGPSCQENTPMSKEFKKVQAHLNAGLEEYIPFVTGMISFDQSMVKEALGNSFYEHPEVSDNLVRKLMTFAIQNEFNKSRVYERAFLYNFDARKHFKEAFSGA